MQKAQLNFLKFEGSDKLPDHEQEFWSSVSLPIRVLLLYSPNKSSTERLFATLEYSYLGDNRKSKEWNTGVITLQSFLYRKGSRPWYQQDL